MTLLWVGGPHGSEASPGGEWLWLRHTVAYDALPDPLVALDLYRHDVGFADHRSRRERIADAGLVAPPLLFDGALGTGETLLELLGTSAFGRAPMEGAVLRRGTVDRCKVVRPGFVRAGDDVIARVRNVVTGQAREGSGPLAR